MFEELEELIPPPGMFLVFGESTLGPSKKSTFFVHPDKQVLQPCLDQERGKNIFSVYANGMNNAALILDDAELLAGQKRYARAVALGITAWEELGKSQVAADFYSGVLSDVEYKMAFKSHGFKTSYLARTGVIGAAAQVATNDIIGERLERIRQDALYVSETNDPKSMFTEQHASFVLTRVREHLEYIHYAEEFNGRIGSKALFK